MLTFGNLSFIINDIFYRGLIMKKVFKILNLLSVVAMSCVLICCSGGGSSSDDDDAPAVSTTSTPTTTTPTSYLARVMYTATAGDNINMYNGCANEGYSLWRGSAGNYAVPWDPNTISSLISENTTTTPATARFWLTAKAGYYIEVTSNNYAALVLPAGVIGSEIDPNTNCWVR